MARLSASESSARRIAKAVTTVERTYLSSSNGVPEAPATNYGSYVVKTPVGGIPARSGTTLGTADCTIQTIDKSTQGVSDGETLAVLNVTDSAIAGGSYVRAVRTKSGDYIAESGGSSGTTVEAAGTLINTHGSNSFSTSSTQTKGIGFGNVKVTDSNVFGSGPTAAGGALKQAGTYQLKIELDVSMNSTVHGVVGTVDTGVPEDPTRDVYLSETAGLRLRLYLHDSASAGNTGTLIDEHQIGREYITVADDGSELDGSDNEFQVNRQYHLTIKRTFGLSQATIDALTGDQARVYLEGHFERATNTFGTAQATVLACYDCLYFDSEFESGDLIAVAVVGPPP